MFYRHNFQLIILVLRCNVRRISDCENFEAVPQQPFNIDIFYRNKQFPYRYPELDLDVTFLHISYMPPLPINLNLTPAHSLTCLMGGCEEGEKEKEIRKDGWTDGQIDRWVDGRERDRMRQRWV